VHAGDLSFNSQPTTVFAHVCCFITIINKNQQKTVAKISPSF